MHTNNHKDLNMCNSIKRQAEKVVEKYEAKGYRVTDNTYGSVTLTKKRNGETMFIYICADSGAKLNH